VQGYIGKYYTVWCGRCTRWDDVPADRRPEKIARKMGWKSSKEYGWLCPNCVNGNTNEWELRT
jgi:hypothetical protein